MSEEMGIVESRRTICRTDACCRTVSPAKARRMARCSSGPMGAESMGGPDRQRPVVLFFFGGVAGVDGLKIVVEPEHHLVSFFQDARQARIKLPVHAPQNLERAPPDVLDGRLVFEPRAQQLQVVEVGADAGIVGGLQIKIVAPVELGRGPDVVRGQGRVLPQARLAVPHARAEVLAAPPRLLPQRVAVLQVQPLELAQVPKLGLDLHVVGAVRGQDGHADLFGAGAQPHDAPDVLDVGGQVARRGHDPEVVDVDEVRAGPERPHVRHGHERRGGQAGATVRPARPHGGEVWELVCVFGPVEVFDAAVYAERLQLPGSRRRSRSRWCTLMAPDSSVS